MALLFKKGFIAFFLCLFVFPSFGKTDTTTPSRPFLRLFNKLFKSQKTKREQCVEGAGKCLFLHDPEEANASAGGDIL